ncbi:MAG: hypothetical protein QXS96_08155 [Candidatus Caldarchaeum sp.]
MDQMKAANTRLNPTPLRFAARLKLKPLVGQDFFCADPTVDTRLTLRR